MERYFLFANPSLLEGMSRVLDIGATLNEYNVSLSPQESDIAAIKSDWSAVGSDIESVIEEEKCRLTSNG